MVQAAAGSTIGRYRIGERLASGGMATVHLAHAFAAGGFSRVVAIKRMLPHIAADPAFATMFCDEARLAARVRHPNVVPTFDVVMDGGELGIVMEYVHGVSLGQLIKLTSARGATIPQPIALAIARDTLQGLHAAHEAVDDDGQPLHIVHRDVSPQNVIVGVDGIARVLDFGIAKANVRLLETRTGDALKGKLAYMAPEQLEGQPVTRACDVFASSILLWESLTATRLFTGENEGAIVTKILRGVVPAPSTITASIDPALDALVLRGLARRPEDRFATASDMALAIARGFEIAPAATVGDWVQQTARELLRERAAHVRAFDDASGSDVSAIVPAQPAPSEATRSAVAAWPAPTTPPAPTPRRRSRFVFGAALGALAGAAALVWAVRGFTASPSVPAAQASSVAVAPVAVAPEPDPAAAPTAATSSDSVVAPVAAPTAPASSSPRRATPPARTGRVRGAPAIPDHL